MWRFGEPGVALAGFFFVAGCCALSAFADFVGVVLHSTLPAACCGTYICGATLAVVFTCDKTRDSYCSLAASHSGQGV
jgi:hypothetical protein